MELLEFYKKIPTYDNGVWKDTEFTDLESFREQYPDLYEGQGVGGQ